MEEGKWSQGLLDLSFHALVILCSYRSASCMASAGESLSAFEQPEMGTLDAQVS